MGSNENDILFGTFADRHAHTMSKEQLDRFETILAEADTDLFNWVTNKQPVPPELDNDVMHMLKNFKLFD